MKNTPQIIWLNIGEADELDANDFSELADVTWSQNKVSSADLKYIREKIVKKRELERNKKDLDFLSEIIEELEKNQCSLKASEMLEHWKDELDKIVNFKKS